MSPSAGDLARIVLASCCVAVAYELVKAASGNLVDEVVPNLANGWARSIFTVALLGFLLISVLQLTLFHAHTTRWGNALRVHFKHGFYLNAVCDRWLMPRSHSPLRSSAGGTS